MSGQPTAKQITLSRFFSQLSSGETTLSPRKKTQDTNGDSESSEEEISTSVFEQEVTEESIIDEEESESPGEGDLPASKKRRQRKSKDTY